VEFERFNKPAVGLQAWACRLSKANSISPIKRSTFFFME